MSEYESMIDSIDDIWMLTLVLNRTLVENVRLIKTEKQMCMCIVNKSHAISVTGEQVSGHLMYTR
jgi:hypothetical protein